MKKYIFIVSFLIISCLIPNSYAEDTNDDLIDGRVYINHLFEEENLLKIQIKIEDITKPSLGIAFHLAYDTDLLNFIKYVPGDYLEQGGDPIYLVKNDNGAIVFGETLTSGADYPMGEGIITELYFEVKDLGVFTFEFSNSVVSTLDEVRQDLENIIWENIYFEKTDESQDIGLSNTNIPKGESEGFLSKNKDYIYGFLIILALSATMTGAFYYLNKKSVHNSVNFK